MFDPTRRNTAINISMPNLNVECGRGEGVRIPTPLPCQFGFRMKSRLNSSRFMETKMFWYISTILEYILNACTFVKLNDCQIVSDVVITEFLEAINSMRRNAKLFNIVCFFDRIFDRLEIYG